MGFRGQPLGPAPTITVGGLGQPQWDCPYDYDWSSRINRTPEARFVRARTGPVSSGSQGKSPQMRQRFAQRRMMYRTQLEGPLMNSGYSLNTHNKPR